MELKHFNVSRQQETQCSASSNVTVEHVRFKSAHMDTQCAGNCAVYTFCHVPLISKVISQSTHWQIMSKLHCNILTSGMISNYVNSTHMAGKK